MTERSTRARARAVTVAALLATLGACGSNKAPPRAAVAAPLDALQLGMQSYEDAQFVAATQLFAKALEQYRSIDDARGQVVALMDLADVALVTGEHARASGQLAEAERLVLRDRLPGFGAFERMSLGRYRPVWISALPSGPSTVFSAATAVSPCRSRSSRSSVTTMAGISRP